MFIFTLLCGASKGFIKAFNFSLRPGLGREGLRGVLCSLYRFFVTCKVICNSEKFKDSVVYLFVCLFIYLFVSLYFMLTSNNFYIMQIQFSSTNENINKCKSLTKFHLAKNLQADWPIISHSYKLFTSNL